MSALHTNLRNLLERTVVLAREEAEKAARAALKRLAVHEEEAYGTLSEGDKQLRRECRAEMRRLGGFEALIAECAYAQWHRMLFARFLAENGLLMHPSGVAVTMQDCAELAQEEGDADAWMAAARYAAGMLPGIFRNEDPTLKVRFAAEGRQALEKLLDALPAPVFAADDSLGWVYQFWQARRKEEVNRSGRKIGGADISPVTQLFTEHYMVQCLLHNSLGAWWKARHPDKPLPTELDYLREALPSPVAQSPKPFAALPDRAADLKILDPCCGSGHFLVAAFALMKRFRMMEENLSEAEAGDAVLRDNLFGLELDPRCTQIAGFALALAAWKSGGYRALPVPNVACSGIPIGDRKHFWTQFADGNALAESAFRRLHTLFENASELGSLIDPERIAQEDFGLFQQDLDETVQAIFDTLAKQKNMADPVAAIFGQAARDAAHAARLLTGKYHLVVTNVPYLARGKQDKTLREFCETNHPAAKADLATVFVERCLNFCAPGGSVALVTPQNWLFLGSYKALRENLLKTKTWNFVARLGPKGFSTPMWDFNVGLFVLTNSHAAASHQFLGIDASTPRVPDEKAELLRCREVQTVSQAAQLKNPDARIALEEHEGGALLEEYSTSHKGITTNDDPLFVRKFWEMQNWNEDWEFHQSTVEKISYFDGMDQLLWYEKGVGQLRTLASAQDRDRGRDRQGVNAWGKTGVAVSCMRHLPVALYTGEKFDTNVAVITPLDPKHLPAIWAFCSSPEYSEAVRRIDQALKVTNASLVKVPFDLERWQQAAAEQYPDGLPEPYSDDPTQWLFHGNAVTSTNPLHVAAALLLGYRWPQQTAPAFDAFADADGIVCLPPVAGEDAAAGRLRELLAAAYGSDWSHREEQSLLVAAEYGGKTLEEWLRDGFFVQHCRLFHNRPFLWQIWDGCKDGFSAIVNYHTLDRQKLERLTFSYLGAWIAAQRDADKRGEPGANARLVAALELEKKLQAILEGEPPYDIYVRWKPKAQQPIGWNPDLNDGVRLNIRPFVTAGVLRTKFTINWNKDRGTNPDGSERFNDLHLTRAEKQVARERGRT